MDAAASPYARSLKCRVHEIEWRSARIIMTSFWLYSLCAMHNGRTLGHCSMFVDGGFFRFFFCYLLNSIWITFSQPKKKMWRKEQRNHSYWKEKIFSISIEWVIEKSSYWIVGLRSAFSLFSTRSLWASEKRHLLKLNRKHGVSVESTEFLTLP